MTSSRTAAALAMGSFVLAMIGLEACAMGDESAVTAVYQEHVGGYAGTRDVWIAGGEPVKQNGGADHLYVGRYKGQPWHTLVKFTQLNIPEGSKIVSAYLTLNCLETSQHAAVDVYGLLKGFSEDTDSDWSKAPADGATTWQMRQGAEAWSQPGAGKASDRLEYDGDGDHFAKPAPHVDLHGGPVTWDVTETFADQFAHGKEYGWLLMPTGESNGGRVRFDSRQLDMAPIIQDWKMSSHNTGADWPVIRYPRLTVTYVPSDPSHRPRGKEAPKLLCFRIDYAGPMSRDLDRVRQMPFDGAVFLGGNNAGQTGRGGRMLCNQVMGPDQLKYEDYTDFIAAMQKVHAAGSSLTDNFLRINAVPGTLEPIEGGYHWPNRPKTTEKVTFWWADGFEHVVNNWRLAARIAKEAGLKGIFYDGELYAGNIFTYAALKDAAELGKSLKETRVQVRKRGEQIAAAIRDVYPDMTMPVIYYVYSDEAMDLWNAFSDGMLAGSDPRMRFVNGNELYRLSSSDQFWRAYRYAYEQCPQLSAVPDRYLQQIQVGFGVWFNRNSWSSDPEVLNYSPAAWQTKLENALKIADSYVWVFTGGSGDVNPNWWTDEHIPEAYYEATQNARDLARQRWLPGVDAPR